MLFCLFKQKTAYELRISDWSSDRVLFRSTAAAVAVLCAVPLAAQAQQDMPGEGTTVHMARATWDTGWWPAEIYKQLLEKLGYEVGEVTTLDNPPFYQAVAQGDVDFWVDGWFPLHNTYEDTFSQGAEKVGYLAKGGALQGYLIDKKTAEAHAKIGRA